MKNLPNYPGRSYLVGYELLLHNSNKTSMPELRQYLFLAGSREYAKYLVDGKKTLPLALCPFSTKMVENNGLLHIKHNKVFFKYEEETVKEI